MGRASRPKRRRKNDTRPQVETLISEEEENQPSDLAGTKRLKRAATLRRAGAADIGPKSLAPVPKPIPAAMGGSGAILGPECFRMDALDLAPRLLGKLLRRDDVFLQITEIGHALGLSIWSNHPLYVPSTCGLEILDGLEPDKILAGPLVGIDYAAPEHVNALWRFAIAGTPRSTLGPP